MPCFDKKLEATREDFYDVCCCCRCVVAVFVVSLLLSLLLLLLLLSLLFRCVVAVVVLRQKELRMTCAVCRVALLVLCELTGEYRTSRGRTMSIV